MMGRIGIGDVILLAFLVCMLTLTVNYVSTANARRVEDRAMECSKLLHGYKDGTIVPLTDDASLEIGACLLQFKQPLGGGE
jgi:hypothetical protein